MTAAECQNDLMPFSLKTIDAFEMTRRMSACEIPAKHKGHRAFVGIYPPDTEHRQTQWRITRFELPSGLIDQSFPQEAMIDWQSLRRDTLEEIEDVLCPILEGKTILGERLESMR